MAVFELTSPANKSLAVSVDELIGETDLLQGGSGGMWGRQTHN
jgi:hypothetical protein